MILFKCSKEFFIIEMKAVEIYDIVQPIVQPTVLLSVRTGIDYQETQAWCSVPSIINHFLESNNAF